MTAPQPPIMKIDHEGFLVTGGELRVQDEDFGAHLLSQMRITDEGELVTTHGDQTITLHAFDQPLVAQMIEEDGDNLVLIGPYGTRFLVNLESLSLDSWDRFHGKTTSGLPFVLSRKAQNEFFSLLDEFDDDWVLWRGQKISTPNFYIEDSSAGDTQFWQEHYLRDHKPWDLGEPAPALVSALTTLKLSRQRVAVLGCGTGEDAAHFASQGHLVTGFDFSPEAIKNASEKFSRQSGLSFVVADVLTPRAEDLGKFDLVFDHAFFIAIPPSARDKLVKAYKKLLTPGGNLLGVYGLFPHRSGPPFGLTEWELQQHLGDDFQHLYWSRARQPRRGIDELVVYSHLKDKG